MAIRVLLLADDEIVRRDVRELLEAEEDLTVVGEAGTAAEALAGIPATQPDVAVLDVRRPDGNSVAVCRDVRSAHPDVPCLMLTSYADDEALLESVLAGAAGFVLEEVRGGELVPSIRRVAAGETLLGPAVATQLMDRMYSGPSPGARLRDLTRREHEVLGLLADGRTNRQIAEERGFSERTIKALVSDVLAKMGMTNRTEAAAYTARLAERRDHGPW